MGPLPPRIAAVDDDAAETWLRKHETGATCDEALSFFDGLPAVEVADMRGRWLGIELPTGWPLEGLLTAYGWYGKDFADAETAHPMLFGDRTGRPRPVNPALLPLGLVRQRSPLLRTSVARAVFTAVRPLLTTRRPTARLRPVEHRGVVTGAMVYDRLPVIDVFRRVSAATLFGVMDMRGLAEPIFFVLRREEPGVG